MEIIHTQYILQDKLIFDGGDLFVCTTTPSVVINVTFIRYKQTVIVAAPCTHTVWQNESETTDRMDYNEIYPSVGWNTQFKIKPTLFLWK